MIPAPPVSQERLIGRIAGDPDGPTVIVTAALHGNEPAGILAARRVLEGLRGIEGLRGELVVFAGNLAAIERRVRFVDLDLNRQWTPARVRALDETEPDAPAEHDQQRELMAAIREVVERARGEIHFIDLHTSSAEGPPFVTVGDTLRNRRFAGRLPLPLILGLEEQLDGSLLEYLNNLGFVTMGVEAGQHDRPESVERHVAVLWLALAAAGLAPAAAVPDAPRFRLLLRQASRGIPQVIEVRRRHAITPADRFRMEPGFSNFGPVRRGQLVAHDVRGPIVAVEDGLILLPLYQGKGDDGFFISREVRPLWLRVSAVLRRLHADRLVPLLPGVRRHGGEDGVLVVGKRIARLYPLEVFHLFGFRKVRETGAVLVVSRRSYDLTGPERVVI